jgi:hypothetical protein
MSYLVLRALFCLVCAIVVTYVGVATLASLALVFHDRSLALQKMSATAEQWPYGCSSCNTDKAVSVCDHCKYLPNAFHLESLQGHSSGVCRELHAYFFEPIFGATPAMMHWVVDGLVRCAEYVAWFTYALVILASVVFLLRVGVYKWFLVQQDHRDRASLAQKGRLSAYAANGAWGPKKAQ